VFIFISLIINRKRVSRKHSQNALISVNCEYVDDAKRKGNLVNIFSQIHYFSL